MPAGRVMARTWKERSFGSLCSANDWYAEPRKPAPGPSLGSVGMATAVGRPGISGVSFLTTDDQLGYLSDWLGALPLPSMNMLAGLWSGMWWLTPRTTHSFFTCRASCG